jgi:hypothetical protein
MILRTAQIARSNMSGRITCMARKAVSTKRRSRRSPAGGGEARRQSARAALTEGVMGYNVTDKSMPK